MDAIEDTYTPLDKAFDFFNDNLFNGKLPPCVITLHRKKGAHGYFWGSTWQERNGQQIRDEIALNPESFRGRSTPKILSTLVHEMCHMEQHHFGKPSRSGYHNKGWAQMMENVGLIPSDTGGPDGKRTGQQMTHYIEPSGHFEKACALLIEKGEVIAWEALTGNDAAKKKKAESKTKYTCPSCDLNAWGKPYINIICGECAVQLECP
jgi:hypothetical protein